MVQVKTFSRSILGQGHPYYDSIRTIGKRVEQKNYQPSINDVSAISCLLQSIKDDYDQNRLPTRDSDAYSEMAAQKMLEFAYGTTNLFITFSIGLLGFLVLKVKLQWLQPPLPFWSTVLSASSIVLGIFAVQTMIRHLGDDADLRDAADSTWTRGLVIAQQITFVFSVILFAWYWLSGGALIK